MRCETIMLTATALALGQAAGAAAQTLRFADDPGFGSFVDIVGFAEPLPLGDDGEADIGTFGGNFIFGPGLIVIGQNGGVAFGQVTVTDLGPLNQPIPSNEAFLGGQATLVYWDDIDDKEGDVFFVELTDDPVLSDRLIVQWNYHNFDLMGSTLKFQLHVLANFEPTGLYAQYMYEIEGGAASAGTSATIGYQDGPAGFGDLPFSFNTAGAVTDGTVLSLLIPGPGDVDENGRIDITDLLLLLAAWGGCDDCTSCPADADDDCAVGITDLLALLANWTS